MIRYLARFIPIGSIVLALLLTSCGMARQAPAAKPNGQLNSTADNKPPTVQVATVQRGNLSSTVSFSGNIQARQQVNIVPKLSGRVVKLAVDVGTVVQDGDVLLELDHDTLAEQVAQAQAGLDAGQAKLNGLQAGPRDEQVAQAEANLKSAQAKLDQLKAGPTQGQLDAAQAQVRLAKNQLYLVQSQADAALGSRLPNTYTKNQKDAQSGVAWEQINVAEANLAQLQAGPTKEQLDQAQAAVDVAQQQLALTKQPVTQTDLDAAAASVAQAKSAVNLAKLQLAEATIRAPFSGVVSQRLVSAGALVGPASPVLTLISNDTEAIVNVDERSLAVIKTGQSATITVNAYPGEKFSATVASVAPTIDPKSRTAQVHLSPQDMENRLHDGMFAQVQFPVIRDGGNTLVVPKSAVTQENGTTVVYVIAGSQIKRQTVTTGANEADQIEIVVGLSEGQKVVTSDLSGLSDGAEVSVQ